MSRSAQIDIPFVSFLALAADLVIDDGPGDPSTNPKYMTGFGR